MHSKDGWCCPAFKFRFDEASKRGLAIVVASRAGQPRFVLQSRAIDAGGESLVRAELPIMVVSENEFHYCPWCGRNLNKWYKKGWRALIRPEIPLIRIEGLDE